jgi:putative transposase
MSEYRSNHNVTYTGRYHVMFCPKYRRKVLTPPIDERWKTILMEPMERWGQEVIAMEVMPEHVHLLVGSEPQFGIHRLSKRLQGYSSHPWRHEYPAVKRRLPSLWTKRYVVAPVGGVTLQTIKRSGETQKGH